MQLVHCLHEFHMGLHVKPSFKDQEYDAVHQEFVDIIQMTMKHAYHSPKFRKLLKKIGQDRQQVKHAFP
ncbi:hypothetical protein L208DRAFT_1277130 [Tricholoma matsutake]|nr:hypothetical protein L208DRAFT_1277130 [Tricholoma matsutake 945]